MLVASYAPTVSWAGVLEDVEQRRRRLDERERIPIPSDEDEGEALPCTSPSEERHLGPGEYTFSEKLVRRTVLCSKFASGKRFPEPEKPLTPPSQFLAEPTPAAPAVSAPGRGRGLAAEALPVRPVRPLRHPRLKLGRPASVSTLLPVSGDPDATLPMAPAEALPDGLAGESISSFVTRGPSLMVTGRERRHSFTITTTDPSSMYFFRGRDSVAHPHNKPHLKASAVTLEAAHAVDHHGLEVQAGAIRAGSKSGAAT